MNNLGLARARQGAVDEGMALEMASLEAAIGQRDVRLEGGSRVYLALLLVMAGDLAQAVLEARTAVDVLAAIPPSRAMALGALAHALLASGRAEDALAAAREGMELLASLGGMEEGESLLRLTHAEALAATGALGAAWDAIAAARDRLLERAESISDVAWRESFLGAIPENARTLQLAREWIDEARGSSRPSQV